mgnify:CR=1 FL=1
MQRVLFHFDPTPKLRAWLAERAGAEREIVYCAEADEARFAALLPAVDVIWHVLKRITPEHVRAASRLRLVQKIGVGVNTIALDAARERGIAVCNMPGLNSRAVAEMTLLLMLAALRRLPVLDTALRGGTWAVPGHVQETLGELGGRTVGLVGAGRIPRLLAPWLAAMGAHVIYSGRSAHADFPFRHVDFDELLATSDVVSLHLPATPETMKMMGAAQLFRMKQGAILVNTARGELVDEDALLAALDSGRLAGAAIDVFATEPLSGDHPLLARGDVVVTPHVAFLTNEMFERSLTFALANSERLRTNQPLENRVV